MDEIKRELKLPDEDFRAVGIHEWEEIEEKLYERFVQFISVYEKPGWLWDHFKQEQYAVRFDYSNSVDQLLKLVPENEMVWLMLNETVSEKTKLWFYEGKIKQIVTALYESTYVDEIYIVSKKYEWLVCINHHDVLIATGQLMPGKLKELEKTLTAS